MREAEERDFQRKEIWQTQVQAREEQVSKLVSKGRQETRAVKGLARRRVHPVPTLVIPGSPNAETL